MLGWIKIYDRPRPGPSGPPERSPATENRKNENKPIRTAWQFLTPTVKMDAPCNQKEKKSY